LELLQPLRTIVAARGPINGRRARISVSPPLRVHAGGPEVARQRQKAGAFGRLMEAPARWQLFVFYTLQLGGKLNDLRSCFIAGTQLMHLREH